MRRCFKKCWAVFLLACLVAFSNLAVAQFETRGSTPLQGAEGTPAVGDFNHDGKLDIAIANGFVSTQVSVLLGNGDGTFRPPVLYSVGSEPDTVAVTDLNQDGNLDLIVGNAFSSDISVLLGNGDGTFQSAVSYPLPVLGSASVVTVSDFNHDNNQDVAVIETSSSCLCFIVFLGKGDGTLQTPALITDVGSYPSHFAAGDFNNDGKIDLAVTGAVFVSSQLQIYLGNGDGTFTPGAVYLSGQGAFDVHAGYVDKDRNLDLVVGAGGGTTILLGNGDGTFYEESFFGPPVSWITLGDFNRDGNLDSAATPASTSGYVSVFPGNGDGSFQAPETFSTSPDPSFMVAADFNNDRQTDLLMIVGTGVANVQVLLNTGVVSFSPITPLAFRSQLVGTSSPPTAVTLTNIGPTALTISSITAGKPFSVNSTCSGSVSPGGTCTLKVTFAPTSLGQKSGTISIRDSASSKPQVIAVSGRGTFVSLKPNPMTFPAQKVGTSSPPQPLAIANHGSTTVSVSGIQVGGANFNDFSLSNTANCTSQPLAPNATCTVSVTFTPKTTGTRSATISVTDNGGGSPESITVTGTGN